MPGVARGWLATVSMECWGYVLFKHSLPSAELAVKFKEAFDQAKGTVSVMTPGSLADHRYHYSFGASLLNGESLAASVAGRRWMGFPFKLFLFNELAPLPCWKPRRDAVNLGLVVLVVSREDGFGPPTANQRTGPSVPWVSLPGPTGVLRCPGRMASEAERQPFVVVGVCCCQRLRVHGRGRVSRSDGTENTYTNSVALAGLSPNRLSKDIRICEAGFFAW